jgi:FtsZ-binding cell division protein ZapB
LALLRSFSLIKEEEMKSTRLPSVVYPAIAAVLFSLLTLFPSTIHAAPDAAEVAGDLKVDAIHFSGDNSVQTSAGPGSFNGGGNNTASGTSSVVGGGDGNTASGISSVVSGGKSNTASGLDSVVSGGHTNTASGFESVVSGGAYNLAGGDYSWAGGKGARVRDAALAGNFTGDQGTFLWADTSNSYFVSIKSNEFAVRATGGVRFVTAVDNSGNPTRTTVIDGNGYVGIGATLPIGPINVTAGNITSGNLSVGTANVNGFEVGGAGTDRYVGMKRDGANYPVLHVTKGNADGGQLVVFFINGAQVGGISTTGTTTTYATSSDARLKENIRPTAFAVDDLMKLEVKDYTFKSDARGAVQTGFLAQDLYRVIPQAVTVGGDDPATNPWQVDYGRLTPFLVKAVQELKTRNDALQAENVAMKADNASMKADNASMKADNASMKERLERVEKLLAAIKR